MKKKDYPAVGDLVICTVENVKNYGANVKLDEYVDKIGFVHIAEISSGWIKYIRDHVREGQKIVCQVINVNPDKGHVDLSLKRVNEHQRRMKIQDWKNQQKAEKLVELLCSRTNIKEAEFFEKISQELIDKYGTLYGAFEESVINDNALYDDGFAGDWIKDFIDIAKENIMPPFVKIVANLEMRFSDGDGIDKIKEALKILDKSQDGITVHYLGAPRYRIVVKGDNFKKVEDMLKKYTTDVLKYIKQKNGTGEIIRKVETS